MGVPCVTHTGIEPNLQLPVDALTIGDFSSVARIMAGATQSNQYSTVQFEVNKVSHCYSAGRGSLVPIEQLYSPFFFYFEWSRTRIRWT